MGKKYYAIPLEEWKKIENVRKHFTELSDNTLKSLGQEMVNNLNEICEIAKKQIPKVHIGGSSAGWRFTFEPNNKEYYDDIESLKVFLKNSIIYDEYNGTYTFEEFWDMVEQKQTCKKAIERSDLHYPQYFQYWGEYEVFTSTNFF